MGAPTTTEEEGGIKGGIAAIVYGKGIILSEQYQGNMNGEEFAEFIRTHFKSAFE